MIGIYIALVSVIFLVAPYCVSPYLSYKNRLVEPLLVGSLLTGSVGVSAGFIYFLWELVC